jgi:hypothetical protein
MKAFIDKYLDYSISKKLTVFIIATIFLGFERIDSSEWLIISSIYIGTQTAIDIIKEFYKK